MIDLEGAGVVITGAGRGLGAALAFVLADRGCRLTLCGRSPPGLDAVAQKIEVRCGRRPAIVELDLADALGVERAAAEIRRAASSVDVLVNNGTAWLAREDRPYTAAEVSGVVGSALTGTFLLTQSLLPALLESKRPDVVTIGSITGLPGAELHDVSVPFFAAKHGQVALAEGLRQLFWGTPVRSICVQPPWLEDLSPLDPAWDEVPSRAKGARATNRDVIEAVIFALTRPRHITLASVTIDSDTGGLDSRGHT